MEDQARWHAETPAEALRRSVKSLVVLLCSRKAFLVHDAWTASTAAIKSMRYKAVPIPPDPFQMILSRACSVHCNVQIHGGIGDCASYPMAANQSRRGSPQVFRTFTVQYHNTLAFFSFEYNRRDHAWLGAVHEIAYIPFSLPQSKLSMDLPGAYFLHAHETNPFQMMIVFHPISQQMICLSRACLNPSGPP